MNLQQGTSTLKSSKRLNLFKDSLSFGSTSTLRREYFKNAQNFSSPYNWPVKCNKLVDKLRQ